MATLELANPKKKNALSLALLDEVSNIISFSLILLLKISINNMTLELLSLRAANKAISVLELTSNKDLIKLRKIFKALSAI